MMTQMINQNQQMMMAILATLGNKQNYNDGDSSAQSNDKK